jgi:hypothetical protein
MFCVLPPANRPKAIFEAVPKPSKLRAFPEIPEALEVVPFKFRTLPPMESVVVDPVSSKDQCAITPPNAGAVPHANIMRAENPICKLRRVAILTSLK